MKMHDFFWFLLGYLIVVVVIPFSLISLYQFVIVRPKMYQCPEEISDLGEIDSAVIDFDFWIKDFRNNTTPKEINYTLEYRWRVKHVNQLVNEYPKYNLVAIYSLFSDNFWMINRVRLLVVQGDSWGYKIQIHSAIHSGQWVNVVFVIANSTTFKPLGKITKVWRVP